MQKPYSTPKAAFLAGVRDYLPMTLGAVPFGLVFGVAAIEVGISPLQGTIMSMFMLAGAAQVAMVELMRNNAAAWVILLSALIVNLRFVIYSASLTPYFQSFSTRWKLLGGFFITDQPFVLSIAYFTEYPDAPHKHWYHLGHSLFLWVIWIISSATGLLVGAVIPESWSLELAIPLLFLGMMIPAIRGRSYLIAAIVSGVIAILAHGLPNNLGLPLAIACGISIGLILENFE